MYFFPKQVYPWGSILEKKRLDTLVGALCCVGRGFGCAGRAGLGLAWNLAVLGALGWVGRGIWLCWARWAGLGVEFGRAGRAGLGWSWDLALLGALGWVGCGIGFLYNYGLHCTCLLHAFMMFLCLCSCVSEMWIILSVAKRAQKQGCCECYLI